MKKSIKEEIKNMLLIQMMQHNSNIASVTVNSVVDAYVDNLSKSLKEKLLFTDVEFASMIGLSMKLKRGDFQLNIDEKLTLLKANSDVNLLFRNQNADPIDEDILIEIANDHNSIIIPYPTVEVGGVPIGVTTQAFKSSSDLLTKLRTSGKYYIYTVYKTFGYLTTGELVEMYYASYALPSQAGINRASNLPKMSQREIEQLKQMGFETNNLDNVDLTVDDDDE